MNYTSTRSLNSIIPKQIIKQEHTLDYAEKLKTVRSMRAQIYLKNQHYKRQVKKGLIQEEEQDLYKYNPHPQDLHWDNEKHEIIDLEKLEKEKQEKLKEKQLKIEQKQKEFKPFYADINENEDEEAYWNDKTNKVEKRKIVLPKIDQNVSQYHYTRNDSDQIDLSQSDISKSGYFRKKGQERLKKQQQMLKEQQEKEQEKTKQLAYKKEEELQHILFGKKPKERYIDPEKIKIYQKQDYYLDNKDEKIFQKQMFGEKYQRSIKELHQLSKVGDWVIDRSGDPGKGINATLFFGYKKDDPGFKVLVKQLYIGYFTRNIKKSLFVQIIKKHAKLMKAFDSPYVVKVYDVIIDDIDIYIVSEYCELGNLREKMMESKGNMTLREIMVIYKQVALGALDLYENNFIHQGIKPTNILFTKNKEGYIRTKLDFGVSKIMDESRIYAKPEGFQYYSPQRIREYLDNKLFRWTSKSDVWSLAIVLYEILEGGLPYFGLKHRKFYETYQIVRQIGNKQTSLQTKRVNPGIYNDQDQFQKWEYYIGHKDELLKDQLNDYYESQMEIKNQIKFKNPYATEEIQMYIRKMLAFSEEYRLDVDKAAKHSAINLLKFQWDIDAEAAEVERQRLEMMAKHAKMEEELENQLKARYWD